MEILSYCTCKEGQDASVFGRCDSRSHICDGGQVREHKVRPSTSFKWRTNSTNMDSYIKPFPKCTQVEDIPTSPEKKGFVPQIVQDGVKNILGVVGGVLNSNRDGREHEAAEEEEPHKVNFTRLFEEAKKDRNLYEGYHLTFFEEDPGCRLDVAGYTAKVYWLWQTGQVCTQNCMNVLHFIPHAFIIPINSAPHSTFTARRRASTTD